jgi:hypothetical protein
MPGSTRVTQRPNQSAANGRLSASCSEEPSVRERCLPAGQPYGKVKACLGVEYAEGANHLD